VKTQFSTASEKCKRKQKAHLRNDHEVRASPMICPAGLHYEVASRISAITTGGVGILLRLAERLGLPGEINANLRLLKIHKPYFESDHVQTIILNILNGGDCLDDIEAMRNDPAFAAAIGADRIPDPTTVGDFLRRFGYTDNLTLLDILARLNRRAWRVAGCHETDGVLDVDGTIQQTFGEKKEGMALSYKGIWGFAPLVITEATTGAHVCVVNRPGNHTSHSGAAFWIDRAIDSTRDSFRRLYLRGDSAFCLTHKFDEWTDRGVRFAFSCAAHQNLVKMAEKLPESRWKILDRKKKRHRSIGRDYKTEEVIERGYRNLRLEREHIQEFEYQPTRCRRKYRVLVVRKTIAVERGQRRLFEDTRYLFYMSNIEGDAPDKIVRFALGRCNHENRIEQLKNGVHAMRMPCADFQANWAYMILLAIAWNLKCWLGLMMPDRASRDEVIRMEFKRFLNHLVRIPCQIVRTGRRVIYRFLSYSDWIPHLLAVFRRIGAMKSLPI
jgi:hypothetical protein